MPSQRVSRMRSRLCASLALVTTLLVVATAHGDPSDPCPGCVVVGELSGERRPLLVVLHGDEGSPTRVLGAWKLAAEKAHVTLFAPRCPKSEGCAGSWWRWNGDPAWLLAQVESVSKRFPTDPNRRYLAGWSGGTTYASFYIPRWFPTFAAVSLAGGGAPPHQPDCLVDAGGACGPVHYLAGDRNPLFSLAEGAHAYLERCGHAVTWELHAGADHAAEWRAYERETGAILGWLLDHPEGCAAAHAATTPIASGASSAPKAPLEAIETAPSALPTEAPREVPSMSRIQPTSRCTCSLDASRSESSQALAWLLGGALLSCRRARRSDASRCGGRRSR